MSDADTRKAKGYVANSWKAQAKALAEALRLAIETVFSYELRMWLNQATRSTSDEFSDSERLKELKQALAQYEDER